MPSKIGVLLPPIGFAFELFWRYIFLPAQKHYYGSAISIRKNYIQTSKAENIYIIS
jgi:hypothetical protein